MNRMTDDMNALIETLDAFPSRVARLVQSCADDRLVQRPAGGGFSIVEQLCHLRDLEREGFAVRIQRIVDEDMPELEEIDGTSLAEARRYQSQSASDALRDWSDARRVTTALLRRHLPDHATRKGIFGGFGVITLAALAEGIAQHDAVHASELEALVSA
jgi:hypothetical protein